MDEDSRIAAVSEVPADGTLLFTVRDGYDKVEGILLRPDDGVTAWKNACPHWTDVRLDKGSGALVRDGEVVCQKHGATFRDEDGFCTHGPCEGAFLDEIEIAVSDGDVYLTDDRYEFEHQGPSGEHDLSSRSRIDFSGT
jgi:nitrite reductase/ring-hydroxylating ferredoxin subunit